MERILISLKIKSSDKFLFRFQKTLKNAINQILKDFQSLNISNCVILLSPAAASFDQFENFEMRGSNFKRLSKIYARQFF